MEDLVGRHPIRRVAIVGADHWHLDRYVVAVRDADREVVAVQGLTEPVKRASLAAAGAMCYDSIDMLLDDVKPDAVISLARPAEGYATGSTVIEAGVPLLVEKPVGICAEQVAALDRAARRANAFVGVAFVNRLRSFWGELPHPSAERIRHLHLRMINGPASRYVASGNAWMLRRDISGGGVLRNLGVHLLDAALLMAQRQQERIVSWDGRLQFTDATDETEDFAAVVLQTDGGATCVLEAGYLLADAGAGHRSAGINEWAGFTGQAIIRETGGRVSVSAAGVVRDYLATSNLYSRYVADFFDRWQAGRAPLAELSDCVEAMVIIDEVYRHADRGARLR